MIGMNTGHAACIQYRLCVQKLNVRANKVIVMDCNNTDAVFVTWA